MLTDISIESAKRCLMLLPLFSVVFVTSCIEVWNIEEASAESSFFSLSATNIDGQKVQFSQYRGKVALVVNTASQCGFTSQYEELEKLYQKDKEHRLVVLGFPSNDFGKQEPGTNAEIKSFCKSNFGVTFPLFAKAPVTGSDKQAVYKFLTEQSAKEYRGDPGWNFVKFLVDCRGQVVGRFSSMTNPSGKKLAARIEELLKESQSCPGKQ